MRPGRVFGWLFMTVLFGMVYLAGCHGSASGSEAQGFTDLRVKYFRLVNQWNTANSQLVQSPLYQTMQKLAGEVSQTRSEMAKLCSSSEELKDVQVNQSDPAEGTEPRCVAKGKAAPAPAKK